MHKKADELERERERERDWYERESLDQEISRQNQ
jgi:hypothetical protein